MRVRAVERRRRPACRLRHEGRAEVENQYSRVVKREGNLPAQQLVNKVFEVCDRVVVMRRGRKVADKRIAESSPEEVTGLITGAIHVA